MMFLQYFTQGAWNMTIGAVLADYGMKNSIGSTYALLGLATLISPLFIGMIADRFLAAQKTIAILHLLNSVILYQIPSTILQNEYSQFFMLIFIVGLLYYPTTALSNSITFQHLSDSRNFPFIRVFGNIGFITAGLIMGYFNIFDQVIVFEIAAFSSLICGLYCFTLPNTPPAARHSVINWKTLLCLDAFILFRDKFFTIFMAVTMLLMLTKTSYSAYISVYLQDFQLNAANMMQIAVISEVIFMLLLSLSIKKFGFKWVMGMGIIAWFIRTYLLSIAATATTPLTYIVISLALQGVCWTFFFATGDVYINYKANDHIRTQAQSLRFMLSNGIGVLVTSYIIGIIYNNVITQHQLPLIAEQWSEFWLYPSAIALVAGILFLTLFKNEKAT
ncbi:TPA: MFS transporter [Mannheimia haemolytica]